MIILKAKYTSGQAFLDSYLSDLRNGGVFIPTRSKHRLGCPVVVYVRFPSLRSKVLVRGKIAWRRAGKRLMNIRAGLGVEFLPVERETRDFLLDVARGNIKDPVKRRYRRVPTDMNIDWKTKTANSWNISSMQDISIGGAFIRSPVMLPVGTPVVLGILAPGGQSKILIEGAVAWTSNSPIKEGMGIEFRTRDLGGKRLVREIIRRLEGTENGVDKLDDEIDKDSQLA